MSKVYFAVLTALCLILTTISATAQEGRIVRETVYSPSLEGNLFGDSPDRQVTIYLPPGYDNSPDMAYPVVCLLHGYTFNNDYYVGVTSFPFMDSWLESGKVKEMILVMPSSYNRLLGSFYTNSTATGNWADYIARDVVQYIDSNYRTLPQRESRAVIGHSMGGYGGMTLGMNYPDVFSCMGSISGRLDMAQELSMRSASYARATKLKNLSDFNSQDFFGQVSISCSAAFCPNPDNPPFYCDFPWEFDESNKVVKNQSAYDRFMEHDILTRLSTNVEALFSMREIYIECGTRDELGFVRDLRLVHNELQRLNVPHYYNEFDGGHAGHVMISIGDALEAFSNAMAFDVLVGVEPVGKLATTWGQIRNW